jgi:lipid-A-disaccharide synthase
MTAGEAAADGSGEELLVVAGEASGDLHGARLLAELRRLRPGLRAFGMGGAELRAAGLEAVADSSEVAVVGVVEVFRMLPRIRQVFAALLAAVDRRRPRAAVLIDFPDFNLRLAGRLARRGIPVIYYVSPQVWAWRRGRVRTIARRVDRMLVLFAFEEEFYRRAGVPAVHVGHPLVDEVPRLPSAWDREPVAGEPYRLALLPGSRRSEVAALLPVMLAAAARLAAELPVAVSLIRAPSIPEALLAGHLEAWRQGLAASGERRQGGGAAAPMVPAAPAVEMPAAQGLALPPPAPQMPPVEGVQGLPMPPPVRVVGEDRFGAIADSHLALCASGTATLEVGLLGTPMIVLYRLALWSFVLAKLLVRLPNFAMVNLVLGREAVPELLQGEAEPERIAAEARRLLADGEARARMRAALAELRPRLGEGGASRRAAEQVAAVLAGLRAGGGPGARRTLATATAPAATATATEAGAAEPRRSRQARDGAPAA